MYVVTPVVTNTETQFNEIYYITRVSVTGKIIVSVKYVNVFILYN